MCGESRTHGFEAEGKKATSGSTVTGTGNSFSPSPLLPFSPSSEAPHSQFSPWFWRS
ncbi:hypothetical protein CKA32_000353 [Geitlerinema sp. FC II]|nr:hypothetical protein CKA32_000353 [Geitlerinema sp. FC II]